MHQWKIWIQNKDLPDLVRLMRPAGPVQSLKTGMFGQKEQIMDKKRVIVVGGGASGLMAAVTAAGEGAAVTLLEHNERLGQKLNATGNGRCNFSNRKVVPDAYRGTHPEFVQEALSRFSVEDTVDFFQRLGISPVERDGYLYPRSGEASSVTQALSMEARYRKVKIKTREHVTAVEHGKGVFQVRTKGWQYEGDAVILACGSKASAISGADGSGYALAEALGHAVVRPLPALTALKCSPKGFSGWAGVRAQGEATLLVEGKKRSSQRGELQLTNYGISGIPIFQLSTYAVRALEEKKSVRLLADFLPEIPAEELEAFLRNRQRQTPYKNTRELLEGLFPGKLCKVLSAQKDLFQALKAFPLTVTGGMSFAQAQVCSGGVSTEEVNPRTMESRLHKGLYFTGELLDIDGTCGGYNLQWAWSSGRLAGNLGALRC